MFRSFGKAVHDRYNDMAKGELFVVDIPDEIDLFARYLESFPAGTDPIFRKRSTHDCNCCKQFIRRLGKVVALVNGEIVTVWGSLGDLPSPYKEVAAKMDASIKSQKIKTVWRTKEMKYGNEYNYDTATNERHDHFWGETAKRHHSADPDTVRSECDMTFQVLQRGLKELRVQDFHDVIDLIEANGLYKGAEFLEAIKAFRDLLSQCVCLRPENVDNFAWANLGNKHARFRNTAIGTLFIDLAAGTEFESAVKAYEAKVAPTNYKRTTAPITQKMVENAVQELTNLGLHGAIQRRYARLTDVSVNDVLFVDNTVQLKDNITQLLESEIIREKPDLKHAVQIGADEFIKTVLPGAKSVEALVENRHLGNFISLTGSDLPDRIFKWNNPFAWTYDGDVTDSVKQRVKAAGGNINALLRVSLSWYNFDDLDLHCMTPSPFKEHIHFNNKMGILDVDMNAGHGRTRNAVENLAFQKLKDGEYEVFVHQYCVREGIDVGFAIEVEFGGQLSQFSYAKALRHGDKIPCFKLKVEKGQLVSIGANPALVGGHASQEKWGVKTETLVPVASMMYSPNHWNGESTGAKHTILALKGCKNPDSCRGIYNEHLRGDLDKHRKVFEVLGAKTKCKFSDDQISGIGFSAARGETVTVVVDGRRSYILGF